MKKMSRNPEKTRQRLLEAAFEEIHSHGFQGMRVDEVLRKTGLQKGAFYHHFKSKTELAYAVLDEEIRNLVLPIWIDPLLNMENPVSELPQLLASLPDRIPQGMREHGCPLNNIAQEMASQDEGFQKRVTALFQDWIKAYTQLFEKAQSNGHVRSDIEAEAIARFVVAIFEGCISISKAEQSAQQWQACQSQLAQYLQSLVP